MISIQSDRTNVRKIAGIFIMPSVNLLTEEDAKKVMASPDFKEDKKIYVSKSGTAQEKPASSTDVDIDGASMTAKELIKALKGVFSVKKLNALREDEERVSVINAIDKRIAEIEEDRADRDTEDSD
ncbi:MAG: hypothetical protein KAU20_07130 [Nanoarchaeota archaeon]|nr:hypothetical protein [Nanoarchaeota archaeon]